MEIKEIKLPDGKYKLVIERPYYTETIEFKDEKALQEHKKALGIKTEKKKPNAKAKSIS